MDIEGFKSIPLLSEKTTNCPAGKRAALQAGRLPCRKEGYLVGRKAAYSILLRFVAKFNILQALVLWI